MTINRVDIFDYAGWIELAPDHDWDNLYAMQNPPPTEVTAVAPTFDDEADTYRVPQKAGVQYLVGGEPATAGVKSVGDVDTMITVTAEAREGYVLTGVASWSFDFTAAPEPEPEPEDPGDGSEGGD